MLEDTRKRGASILIYLVFGTLIAVFIINFGPQSRGSGQGCHGAASNAPITVGDVEVPKASYIFLYQGFFRNGSSAQRAAAAFDALTRREILAQAAEDMGMRIPDDLVDDAIKQGNLYYLLRRQNLRPGPGEDKTVWFPNGFFDYKSFKSWVSQTLGLTVGAYKSVEKREMLATLMADQIKGSAQASWDEAHNEFMYENTTVTFDAVKFVPAAYKAAMKVTQADVDRFAKDHAAEIDAKYKADERLYQNTGKWLQLRWIQVAKAEPAPQPQPAGSGSGGGSGSGSAAGSGSGPGPGSATPPVKDDNLDKLKQAKADIEAKKKTFADYAKTLNKDDTDRANAGMLGWRKVDAPKLGDPMLNDAIKTLEVGKVSDVITTAKGHYLLWAEATREGNLNFDQVKDEIATDMAKDVWSKEAAKRDALKALADARGDATHKGKNLDEMYEKTKQDFRQEIGPGGIQLPPGMNLTPEQMQQLQEQLMKQQQDQGGGGDDDDGDSGSITVTTEDIPAWWGPGSDGGGSNPGSGTGSGTAAGSSTGSGSGGGSGGSGTGSGSGGTGTGGGGGGPTPPGPDTVLEPTKDVLPPYPDVAKPTVTRLGPIPKTRGELGDIGTSKELVQALFDPNLTAGMLGKKVYVVGDDYVIVQVATKDNPNEDEFAADADKRIQDLREARGTALLQSYLKTKCEELNKAGKIKPDARLLRTQDDKGNEVQNAYEPCQF